MREPISGHEVVKKKRDCNNLEKETAGLEKVKVIARIHTDFPTKFGIPRQSGLSDATGLVVFEPEFRQPDALRGFEKSRDADTESGSKPSYQNDPERVYGMEFAGFEVKFRVEGSTLYVVSVTKKQKNDIRYINIKKIICEKV